MSSRKRAHKIYQSFKQKGLMVRPDLISSLADSHNTISSISRILSFVDTSLLASVQGVVTKEVFEDAEQRCSLHNHRLSLTEASATGPRQQQGRRPVAVVSAHDTPCLVYLPEEHTFCNVSGNGTSMRGSASDSGQDAPSASARRALKWGGEQSGISWVRCLQQRFYRVLQRVQRHPRFMHSGSGTAPGGAATLMRHPNALELTAIQSLLGSTKKHAVLGVLARGDEGGYVLVDPDGSVKVDFSKANVAPGVFAEGCIVVAQGVMRGGVFELYALAFPPAEPAAVTRQAWPQQDFTGVAPLPELASLMKQYEDEHSNRSIVVLSDVWLDRPIVFTQLRRMFEGFSVSQEDGLDVALFIMIGNFLADLITSFPTIANTCHFVFVPGPRDLPDLNCIPHHPIPEYFTKSLRTRLPRAVFTTNPCRIRYCTQEIVVYRHDMVTQLHRSGIAGIPSGRTDSDLHIHVVRTVVEQGHLSPLPTAIQPVDWAHDHSLALYPLPTLLLLADSYDQYTLDYEGCQVANSGSFGTDYSFLLYTPTEKSCDFSQVPLGELESESDEEFEEVEVSDGGKSILPVVVEEERMDSEDGDEDSGHLDRDVEANAMEVVSEVDDEVGDDEMDVMDVEGRPSEEVNLEQDDEEHARKRRKTNTEEDLSELEAGDGSP